MGQDQRSSEARVELLLGELQAQLHSLTKIEAAMEDLKTKSYKQRQVVHQLISTRQQLVSQ